MGSLDNKSKEKGLEPDIEIESNESEPMVDSATTSDKDELLELMSDDTIESDVIVDSPRNEDQASCSSSMSSSDFILEDPFQYGSMDYSVEIPPIQVMERQSSERYRISSSVFGKNESSNISGWGIPSNESLFSINMRGMSFRNQDSMRYGELDLEPSPCGTPIEVGTIPELDETSDSDASVEVGGPQELSRPHKLGEEDKIQSLSEISNNHGSCEPISPSLQGNESVVEELNSHFAAESNDRSSFAFPILTANTDKGTSSRITSSTKTIPQTATSETQPNLEPEIEPDKQNNQSEPPKAEPPAATWTNCFGCCASCS